MIMLNWNDESGHLAVCVCGGTGKHIPTPGGAVA